MTDQASVADDGSLMVFALGASRELGTRIATRLGVTLAHSEEREFEDGEHKARPLQPVQGRDVVVVHSLYGDAQQSANDKLCRLLFFCGAVRDAGANSVTAVAPYLCYARKDRRTKTNDPVTTRYVASMFEAVGIDAIICLDVHNTAAFDNAFRCVALRVDTHALFAQHFAPVLGDDTVVVLSPDSGGIKRAAEFRSLLSSTLGRDTGFGFMEKARSRGVVSGERLFAEVGGQAVVIVDDMISTGTTLLRAAQACRANGASKVYAAATHGLFIGGADSLFDDPAIDQLAISDSVAPFRVGARPAHGKLVTLASDELLAESIRALRGERTRDSRDTVPGISR